MTDLMALADRVEALPVKAPLSGSFYDENAAVALAFGWRKEVSERREAMAHADREEHVHTVKDTLWFGPNGERRQYFPPCFTTSLDAAMTLVSILAFWRLGHDGEGEDPGLFKAHILSWTDGTTRSQRNSIAIAATPALALTAAALRARSVKEPEA